MKRLIFIVSIFATISCCSQNITDSITYRFYKEIITSLTADDLAGRPASSPYEKKVVQLLQDYFRQVDLKPKLQVFTYHHPDSLKPGKSVNVYAIKNNHADSTIIIGAHYDHIGMGGKLSRSLGKNDIHNGADDNASGVALLLGMALHADKWMNKKYNYIFIAFSAHEIGLYGSEKFYTHIKAPLKKIALMVNFDMVGRMNPIEKWLKIFASADQLPYIESMNGFQFNLKVKVQSDSTLSLLDTRVFNEHQLPCLSLTTGIHDDYHKISDDEVKINYEGIRNIQEWLIYFLRRY